MMTSQIIAMFLTCNFFLILMCQLYVMLVASLFCNGVHLYRFIYTDDVNLTPENVTSILYASKKYIVTNLTKKCAEFLEENISAETAAMLLEQSMVHDVTDLKDKVLKKIEEESSAVLSSDDFPSLSKEALHEVLQLNLKISNEIEVFGASLRWAKSKCQEMEKADDGANLREVLGDNLFLIRFPTMTLKDFSDIVAPCDILTTSEGFQLFRYFTAEKN